jgi:SNF2 family DNA or RNA helicase
MRRAKYRYKPYVCHRRRQQKQSNRLLKDPQPSSHVIFTQIDEDESTYKPRNPLPHQKYAMCFLHDQHENKKARGTIVHLKMGLGKTFIVLRFFLELLHRFKAFRLLFVTKHDIVAHIKEEVKIEMNSCLRSTVQVKSYREIQYGSCDNSCDILVLDESHDIYQKKKLTCALTLIPRSFVVLLTGSAGSKREVQQQWETLVDTKDTASTAVVYRIDVKLLENVVKTANEHNVCLQMTASQEVYYEKQVAAFKCCKQGIMKVNAMRSLRKNLSTFKIAYVTGVLQDAICKGLKIVVFSEFASVLLQLRLALPQRGVVACDGTVQSKQRQKQLREFRNNDNNHILVASTSLFSHGVDLGFCHGLVHMEPPWQGHTQRQTNARIERLGQVSAQKILFVLFQNTLETKLLASNKQAVFDI